MYEYAFYVSLAVAVIAAAIGIIAVAACFRTKRESAAAVVENQKLKSELDAFAQVASAREANLEKRLDDKEAACRQLLQSKDESCRRMLADRDAQCERLIRESREAVDKVLEEKKRSFEEVVKTLQEKFTNLAAQKLGESTRSLSDVNEGLLAKVVQPFHEELDRFRKAFDEDRRQQVENKASFDRAIDDLGKSAMRIGADAENLAKALKNESKTQGDWGEMVLGNILSAAGLCEGRDFIEQAPEYDAAGNKLIPDVEIPLPNHEKLLIDSKASVTAYLDYVAAQDDAAKAAAVKAHLASVRKHMDELADKQYTKKIKGSQGYILMFIPNEGSYLLAMEHDRKLATDAFRRHVIIVNPTTLLLCLQIVALLRSRESLNENAEKISQAAAKMYDKFVVFAESFVDVGKRVDGLSEAYRKANGQLCSGNANVVKQLEALKGMGVVTSKSVNQKLLDEAGAPS